MGLRSFLIDWISWQVIMMAYITSEVDTPSWFKIRKILVLQTGIVDYAYAQIISQIAWNLH